MLLEIVLWLASYHIRATMEVGGIGVAAATTRNSMGIDVHNFP
jgi:hypothetical protein